MKFSHNISYMKFVSIPYNDFIYEIFIYEMLCEIFVRAWLPMVTSNKTFFFSPWFSGVEKQRFSGVFYDQNIIIRNGS